MQGEKNATCMFSKKVVYERKLLEIRQLSYHHQLSAEHSVDIIKNDGKMKRCQSNHDPIFFNLLNVYNIFTIILFKTRSCNGNYCFNLVLSMS